MCGLNGHNCMTKIKFYVLFAKYGYAILYGPQYIGFPRASLHAPCPMCHLGHTTTLWEVVGGGHDLFHRCRNDCSDRPIDIQNSNGAGYYPQNIHTNMNPIWSTKSFLTTDLEPISFWPTDHSRMFSTMAIGVYLRFNCHRFEITLQHLMQLADSCYLSCRCAIYMSFCLIHSK